MIEQGVWGLLGVLAALVAYQQFRMYQMHQAAKHRDELFQIVTENAADMIALVDVKGRRLYNSPAYKRILGYSPAELSETSAFEQIHPDDRFKVLEAAQEARTSGRGKRLEYRIRHKDGTWRTLESIASTIRSENGDVVKLVIVNRDITQRKHAEEQLEHHTFHDALTGLPNRRLFLDRLEHLFLRSKRNADYHYAVLFVDIDRFKTLNENLGHAIGDALIIEIGRRLSACLRHIDTTARPVSASSDNAVSRFGGDEFAILLDSVTEPSDAMRVAQRIQTAVAEPFEVAGHVLRASLSVGIAMSTKEHERVEDLLQDADVAVRRAKGLGGARCEVFDEAMHTSAVRRLQLETELKTAIHNRQFRVFYQPVVNLENKTILGFEALLRWQHPEHGLISPMKFLEVAEDSGLLVSIGRWLISEACQQLRAWQMQDHATDPLRVSVNLSSRQLAEFGLVNDLRLILQKTGLDPSSLQLELSESVAMADPQLSASVFSQLRQLGVGIILDSFGTGRSSLSELRHFPVDSLKIDRSLVSEMLTNRATSDIVDLIITLAHKLNHKVFAEGIETGLQLARLREFGCDWGQGYLFSQPLNAEQVQPFLKQHRGRENRVEVP